MEKMSKNKKIIIEISIAVLIIVIAIVAAYKVIEKMLQIEKILRLKVKMLALILLTL